MSGFVSGRPKRKEVEEAYDEFLDFPLCSPARKIRRLDADMLSGIEGNKATASLRFNQPLPTGQIGTSTSELQDMGLIMDHSIPIYPPNHERSLVLYNPSETSPIFNPNATKVSFKVSSDLMHGIKSHFSNLRKQTLFDMDEKVAVSNKCLALVPWVPLQVSPSAYEFPSPEWRSASLQEPMEAEEVEAAAMEVDENREQTGISEVEVSGLHQWQQHCLNSQPLPNASSPIIW